MDFITTLPIDNQASIIHLLNYDQLMKLIKIYEVLKIDETLWEKVIHLAGITTDKDRLKIISNYDIYIEHLIKSNYKQTVELKVEREAGLSFIFEIKTAPYNTITTFSYYEQENKHYNEWMGFIRSAENKLKNRLIFRDNNGFI